MPTILTVDDEPGIRAFLADTLAGGSQEVVEAADGEGALRALEDRPFDVLILDLRMPGALDGMAVLRQARARWPETQVILLTAFGTVGNAVEAMQLGAFDFLEKPLESPDAVRAIVRRALNWRGRRAAPPPTPAQDRDSARFETFPARPSASRLRSLLHELRRRHVYHAAATYAAISLAALQIGQLVLPVLPVPGWTYAALVGIAIVGLPVVVALGWIYDVSLTRTSGVPVSSRR
jgi:DNA-binding NtrC family response regulator